MEKIESKKQLNYINYLRAIAIIFIVAGHTLIWGKPGHSIQRINSYFLQGGTLLFIFIAGFLFQYLSYKFDYKNFLINKFKNVIMPYWITMFPIAIYFAFNCTDTKNFLYSYPPIIKFINTMLFGQIINIALWFIPMIVIFYLVSPLLLKLKKQKILWYSILICTIFSTITLKRPNFIDINTGSVLLDWNFKYAVLYIYRFWYFLPIYMLGMDICELFEKQKEFINSHINKIIFISLICWLYFFIYFVYITRIHHTAANIGRVALTFFFLGLFYKLEDFISNRKILDKTLKFIADYSFGIFFIHCYIFYLLSRHIPYRHATAPKFHSFYFHDSSHAFLGSFGYFLITFLGSILILYLIKKGLEASGIKNTRMFIGVGKASKPKQSR